MIILFQTLFSDNIIGALIGLIVTLISCYTTYRLTKPKTMSDVHKTESEITKTYNDIIDKQREQMVNTYDKLSAWIDKFEVTKKEMSVLEDNLIEVNRQLKNCLNSKDSTK